MPDIVHFEFDVKDPERAADFYSKVFGWKINKWEGPMDYWLIQTGPDENMGVGGAFMKRSEREQYKNQMMNTIDVDSIDEFMKKIENNGGKMLSPKMSIPGIGYHAYFQDTEGNVFGIMQADQNAGS